VNTPTGSDSIRVHGTALRQWALKIFAHMGVPGDDAALASDALVNANMRGVDTHGVMWLPIYVQRLRSGLVNPRPQIRVTRNRAMVIGVDGDSGLGIVVAARAMQETILTAKEFGLAATTVRNSNHFGAAGYFARMATSQKMIGIAMSNAGPAMAPWNSVTPYLGTNPLAFAAPGGIEGGIVLDMATSQVAGSRVLLAMRAGLEIPPGWATDLRGRPTRDARVAWEGLMMPLGGYKGYGLALMVEILCGIMSGSSFGPHLYDSTRGAYVAHDIGHFFLAIEIEAFMPLAVFQKRLEQCVDEIRACSPLEGTGSVYVPGDIEAASEILRAEEGIPIPGYLLHELRKLGTEVGECFPL